MNLDKSALIKEIKEREEELKKLDSTMLQLKEAFQRIVGQITYIQTLIKKIDEEQKVSNKE